MKFGASHAVALFVGAVGAVGVGRLNAPVPGTEARELRLVNMEVSFRPLEDGGVESSYRACGYLERHTDAGTQRLGEPCWRGELRPGTAETLIPWTVEDGVKAVEADKARWP